MKKIYPLLATVTVAMASVLPAEALQPVVKQIDVPARYEKAFARKSQGRTMTMHRSGIPVDDAVAAYRARRASRADEQTYTLKINLKYNPDAEEEVEFIAWAFDATVEHPTEFQMGFFDEDESAWTIDIVPGKYNIEAQVNTPEGVKFLLRDDVTVSGDTELNFDVADATNHIVFKTVNTKGEPIADNIYDPATDYETVLIPGNYEEMTCGVTLNLFYHERATSAIASNNFSYQLPDGTVTSLAERDYSVWMTPTKNFTVGQVVTFGDKSGANFVNHYASEVKTQTITNDAADFVTVEDKIVKTPHRQIVDPDDEWSFEVVDAVSLNYFDIVDGLPAGISRSNLTSSAEFDVPDNILNICSKPGEVLEIAPAAGIVQDCVDDYNFILGLPVKVEADRSVTRFALLPPDFMFNDYFDYDGNQTGTIDPRFTYKSAPEMAYGSSMPFTMVDLCPWDKTQYQFRFVSVGRFGEVRPLDRLHTSVSYKVNGEAQQFESLDDLFGSWYDTPLPVGKIEIDIESNNFVASDLIRGINTCHTEFDTSRDDYEAPALRALRTLNAAEEVAQSFATADEAAAGFVEIAAADLHMNQDRGFYDYTLPAPAVKVEYAPCGKDNFAEIAMTEKPEWLNAPGFGRHFIGSLPKVAEKAYMGWFDLRITLTDAAGNSQTQLISPAFQVMEVAGVEAPEVAADAVEVVARYNLQGQLISNPAEGQVVIERLSDNSARKVRF